MKLPPQAPPVAPASDLGAWGGATAAVADQAAASMNGGRLMLRSMRDQCVCCAAQFSPFATNETEETKNGKTRQ